MGKSLVVVESPAKATTIHKILGDDFVVKSCMGHVRDLPARELGVDVDDDFAPRYVTVRGQGKVLSELKRAAATAQTIYLATDPDREGEAIAWHVAAAIAPDPCDATIVKRMLFNEITPAAVQASIEQCGGLDVDKINAQQARRVLDRLVGYQISPLLWKVIHAGLSAGRVQSAALRMICERDVEVDRFEPQEYWSVDVLLHRQDKAAEPSAFKARVRQQSGKDVAITNDVAARRMVDEVTSATFIVDSVSQRQQRRRPAAPFITSTLQQEAARKLRFGARRTMAVAQQLYEGIEVDGETIGLISYMRTDSVRVSTAALDDVREHIRSHFGADYVPPKANLYKPRRGAQDAHEAIRPTLASRTPGSLRPHLTPDQARLYELVWQRFVASQMEKQVLRITTIDIAAGDFALRAAGSSVLFAGFSTLYQEGRDEPDEAGADPAAIQIPPGLQVGDRLEPAELIPQQHFTRRPPRFSEASLVKELESRGLGRPSTFAQIISTLQDREYVDKVDRYFESTERGQTVSRFLVSTFPGIFDVAFTAKMEDELDLIERGERDWIATVRQFYDQWRGALDDANARRQELKQSFEQQTDVVCEACGQDMVIKWGRNGRFLACPAFPQCTHTRPLEQGDKIPEIDETCQTCDKPMVIKVGPNGRFLACSGYPDCRSVKPLPLGLACPDCDSGEIVERRSRRGRVFWGCNQYPACKFASWDRPTAGPCAECRAVLLYDRGRRSPAIFCKVCQANSEPSNESSKLAAAAAAQVMSC